MFLKKIKSHYAKAKAKALAAFEDEDGSEQPSDDDAFFAPCGQLGSRTSLSVDGKHIGEFKTFDDAEDALITWINKNKFYPTMWQVSDHGNYEPHTFDSTKAKKIKM